MNYEDMSDFEINKLVAINDNRTISEERTKMLHDMCKSLSASDSSVALEMPDGGCIFFDPCNNPSHAHQILIDNGIIVDYSGIAMMVGPETYKHMVKDKNPLRAAMICFLKMKDAEK